MDVGEVGRYIVIDEDIDTQRKSVLNVELISILNFPLTILTSMLILINSTKHGLSLTELITVTVPDP